MEPPAPRLRRLCHATNYGTNNGNAEYGACTVTCNGGVQRQTRAIITYPANGGQACGALSQTVQCNVQPCPVDCQVSQWATYGWYPTFVPVVSIAPATVLAFGGTIQAVVIGAVLGALIGPPLAAAVARRLPRDFHPFIGNVVSMAAATAAIVTALSVTPGFG